MTTKILVPSDHQAQAHGLPSPKEKHVAGHVIVIEGFYLANDRDDKHNGHHEKKRVRYSETFEIEPREKALYAQGALSHILGDGKLAKAAVALADLPEGPVHGLSDEIPGVCRPAPDDLQVALKDGIGQILRMDGQARHQHVARPPGELRLPAGPFDGEVV